MDETPHIPATSGIYRITCVPTGKFYIGSTDNLQRRWKQHFHELQRKAHENPKLQNAWDKYGSDAFTFEILELVLAPFLPEREQYWLDTLKPFDRKGFNCHRFTQRTRLGAKASPETLAKLRAAQRGKHGKGIPRIERDGYTPSRETREKMRLSHIGKKPSQPPPSFKGKKHSAETKEKMRSARLGRHLSAEAIAINRSSKSAQMKTLVIIAPDGTEHVVTGIKAFCREHGLNCSNLMRVAKGIYTNHKGWKARFLN